MPCRRLFALTLLVCVGLGSAAASEGDEQGARPAPVPAAAPLVVDFLPPPPSLPPLPLELVAPVGFEKEFAQRLGTDGRRLGAADRADRAALVEFYAGRQNEPVWITPTGPSAAAEAVAAELGRAGEWGLEPSAFRLPPLPRGRELGRDVRADAEIALSLAVLKYARHARGGRTSPSALSRNLDRRSPLLDPRQAIEAAAAAERPDTFLRSLHPQHPQFERLRRRYLALGGGRAADAVETAAERRASSGKSRSQGSERAELGALLANMEQWRWMPRDLGSFHVWVNVPEFSMRVVEDGRIVHSERVIVGRTETPTPVFSDEIEQVIFHPFWSVPQSIKQDELLPSLARGNMGVLARNNLRISYRGRDIDPRSVDWARADMRRFHVYQPPGSDNVLGVVKFRFPNRHAVYLHDTPAKRLFNASVRTFSHGCMRVRDPLRLATLLLAHDQGWAADRVAAAVRRGPRNNHVTLRQRVPVHITYFTAWVADDGSLKRFRDVYGHERRIVLALAGKAHLIPRETPRSQVARARPKASRKAHVAARPHRRADNSWMRQVFGN
jgi:murein L,D-transpeptidase YcbB/YkuD